jgi:uncharacterized protein YjbI with pentapeptide repeats
MNEKSEPVAPHGFEEAPVSFAPAAPVPPSEPPRLSVDQLRDQDLRKEDLTKYEGLLPEHLAGSDLTGNQTVPDKIKKFPALEQVKAISSEARKIFIALLAACVYSWLVIGTTTDLALILNSVGSPLPIINTPIPTVGFYVVGAAILAAVYCYLHFYLQRLWRTLATLPAIFPDGVALDDKTDPWLLTNLVRTEFTLLRPTAPPLARLENLLAVFLTWWLVPLTLLALWTRFLPAHSWLGMSWLVLLIFVSMVFGQHTYRLAHAALQGKISPVLEEEDRDRGIIVRAWKELRGLRVGDLTVCLTIALTAISYSGFVLSPRDEWTIPWALDLVGIRTYADLREVAQKPEASDGKDLSKVDLRGRNLAFADARNAFLANADLRNADLAGADLLGAQLQGTDLRDAQLQGADLHSGQLEGADLRDAQLQGANLRSAQLQGANLRGTQLQGAMLPDAQLQGAILVGATLQGANLTGAQLQGANLYHAHLQGADLRGARLQGVDLFAAQLQGAILVGANLRGANLLGASLQGANLFQARLQGANLFGASLQGANLQGADLQGADLRRAALWRAQVPDENWKLADLRDSSVKPMTKTEADKTIVEASAKVTNESQRGGIVERLTNALEAEARPSRPEFPVAWQSEPNVMFDAVDPEPEPFSWGPRKWVTEQAYDEELADFVGDLGCGGDVPEAQTRGLASRALATSADPVRPWPKLFAARVIGPDCPPAERLPEDMRRQLEQLAAKPGPSKAP